MLTAASCFSCNCFTSSWRLLSWLSLSWRLQRRHNLNDLSAKLWIGSEWSEMLIYLSRSWSISALLPCWSTGQMALNVQSQPCDHVRQETKKRSHLIFVLLFFGLTGLQKWVNGGQLLDQLGFLYLYLLQLRAEGLHLSRALPGLSLQSPNVHLALCKSNKVQHDEDTAR